MYDEFDLLSLRAPAGNGQENEPDDIAALDRALRRIDAYTPPPEYADGPQRYATEPMINALTAFQEQNGLKLDGYANPGGPTERALNNRLLSKPKGTGLLFEPPGPLTGTVGSGFQNERRDVATVQRMLGALDYMPEDPYDRPPGFIDERTTEATRRYQRDMGLEPDGWIAPGGETETALRDSISDLARDKGRDWFAFAERAGKAQARMPQPLSARGDTADDATPAEPVAWRGPPPDEHVERRARPSDEDEGEARVEPAQTAPGDVIVPGLLWLLGALGVGAEINRRTDAGRAGVGDGDKSGGRTEFIPPRTDDDAYRGADPTTPRVDPSQTRPGRNPDEPPLKLPDKTENIPPRIDPRDYILITPAESHPWAERIFVENRRGVYPETRDGLEIIAKGARKVAEDRSDVEILHIGGSRNEARKEVQEYYAPNRDRKARNEDARKGASYADLTLKVGEQIIHISFYRARPDGSPKPIEIDQAERLAYNTLKPNIVIMIENKYGKEAINQKAVERFINDVVDAVRAGAGDGHLNVRDPQVREKIIRYFDAYKPK